MKALQPGEQLDYTAEWPARNNRGTLVSPGRYMVKGVLNMDPPEKLETSPRELLLVNN